ncbi:hypothetical protein ACP70R_031732 [Stipagrostis hirtigluma subsp. patula]
MSSEAAVRGRDRRQEQDVVAGGGGYVCRGREEGDPEGHARRPSGRRAHRLAGDHGLQDRPRPHLR